MVSAAASRFDVVVVGAGAAGCVLAADLAAADPARNVLLLDAGPAEMSSAVASPVYFDALAEPGRTFADARVVRVAGGAPSSYVLGRGVGGGTAVNGMVCAVEPSDFDRWRIDGWAWTDVARVARRLRRGLRRVPAEQLGALDRALFLAGRGTLDVGVVDVSLAGGVRQMALDVALGGGAPPENLVIRGDAVVRRVVLDGRRAVGVELAGGEIVEGAEVVVSAGAIHSPVLLLSSGVVGEGIGSGLQDHPSASLTLRLRVPARIEDSVSGVMARWDGGRLQALAMNHVGVQGYGALVIGLMRPRSVGRIAVRDGAPHVEFGMFADRRDLDELRTGVQRVARLTAADGFRNVADAVFIDDRGTLIDALADDAAADRWLAAHPGVYYHASSSCRLGDAVDPCCRVFGYEALRVCDAGIFPGIPSTNPMLPAMILGGRLAEIMAAQ